MLDRAPKPAREEPWRRLSGLHTVRGRRALAVARALWVAREEYAQESRRRPRPARPRPGARRRGPRRSAVQAGARSASRSSPAVPAVPSSTAGGRRSSAAARRRSCRPIAAPAATRCRRRARGPTATPTPTPGSRPHGPRVEACAEQLQHARREPADPRAAAAGRVDSAGARGRGIHRRALAELGARPWQIAHTAQADRRCLCGFRASPVRGARSGFVGFRHPIPARRRPLLGWTAFPYFWRQSGRDLGRLLRRWSAHPLRARRRKGHVLEHPRR